MGVRQLVLGILLVSLSGALAAKGPGKKAGQGLTIPLLENGNVFEPGQEIRFEVQGLPAGTGAVTAKVVDYFGKEVWKGEQAAEKKSVSLAPGQLGNGYYELTVDAEAGGVKKSGKATFGVAPMVDRSAADALKGGYRFGLKMGGAPGGMDSNKAMNVAARMGLQWTRQLFTRDMQELAALPVNIIYKIEGFPEEAYDEQKYGPRDEFRLRHFGWKKATIPKEEPYKAWLKGEIAKLPKESNVFEIWNEPWGKIPAQDFAKVAQWAKDVIREVRPDAKVGPNLGHLDYDSGFIAAGGMKGMDALMLHPYGHPERTNLRADIRRIRDYYKEHAGHDVELYVTEFGHATPPAGPGSETTENHQANRGVRTALALYAEDVKGFMPHVLGQTEGDPTNGEHWRGYFRANGQPKPALFAQATAARMIDGGRYVGDLFLKPDVGAQLYEKKGQYFLVLWANDLTIPVEVATGESDVQIVDVMGRETKLATPGGKASLTLTGDPVYLVGVNADLAKSATTALREDQWVTGKFVRGSRDAHRMKTPPAIDGKIDEKEWAGQTKIEISNPKVDANDSSAIGYVAWDKDFLYVAIDVRDNAPYFNPNLPKTVFDGDSMEVFVGSQPKYQIPEFLNTHDAQMIFSPTSADGKPVAGTVNRDAGTLDELPGLKMAPVKTDKGWSMELAIPLKDFKEFPGEAGHQAAFEMRLNDADPGHGEGKNARRKINPVDGTPSHQDATLWDYLNLVE